MTQVAKKQSEVESRTIRVLGRGLRVRRGVRLTLRTLREAVGRTQLEVERTAKINQADVSRLESRSSFDESLVSTLQRYVEALGGELELTAVFGDKRITLVGVEGVEASTHVPELPAGSKKSRGRASSNRSAKASPRRR